MWRFVSDGDTNKNVFFANDVDEVPRLEALNFPVDKKYGISEKNCQNV